MAKFFKVWENVHKWESGYKAESQDPGDLCGGNLVGTNHGISAPLLKNELGRCPKPSEMKALSKDKAGLIWKKYFYDPAKLDLCPSDTLAELYLYSIGGGSSGNLHVKEAYNNVIGKNVFKLNSNPLRGSDWAIIHGANSRKMFAELTKIRRNYFTNHPNKTYITGWLNRLNDINL